MNENFESTGEWAFTQERGKQTGVPGETPPKNRYCILEVKIHHHLTLVKVVTSSLGQKMPAVPTKIKKYYKNYNGIAVSRSTFIIFYLIWYCAWYFSCESALAVAEPSFK